MNNPTVCMFSLPLSLLSFFLCKWYYTLSAISHLELFFPTRRPVRSCAEDLSPGVLGSRCRPHGCLSAPRLCFCSCRLGCWQTHRVHTCGSSRRGWSLMSIPGVRGSGCVWFSWVLLPRCLPESSDRFQPLGGGRGCRSFKKHEPPKVAMHVLSSGHPRGTSVMLCPGLRAFPVAPSLPDKSLPPSSCALQINCVTFPHPDTIPEQQLLKPTEWSYCDYFWVSGASVSPAL